jgi:uncharacterized repeat protein (TIGR03803 family)
MQKDEDHPQMKMCVKNPLAVPLVLVALASLLADQLTAQTFTTLYSFTPLNLSTYANADGARPQAGVILSGNTLYGTTDFGSDSGNGTVFKINIDGTGFQELYNFTTGTGQDPVDFPINSDGARPVASLFLSGNTLYGTASAGGSSGNGTVFTLNADGTGFRTLHSFTAPDANNGGTNSDGAKPSVGLSLLGGVLYGATSMGGGSGKGAVFSLKTDGTGFALLS